MHKFCENFMADDQLMPSLDFDDLQTRFGLDNAVAILRALEQFEGISEANVRALPLEQRMKNVFSLMMENMRCQTRH